MASRSSFISNWLSRADPRAFSIYCIVASFGTYFCMYAFHKPFTAGTFEDVTLWGIGFKTVLVTAHVSGYALSKFLGIRFVSEAPVGRRAIGILVLIGSAEAALLLFAITPPPWNLVWLFVNGLPLGMVFGLVLVFLEGRQLTEALVAGLCASFILSSGFVKSVGRLLILDWGVSEYWMPFFTGLLFVFPLLAFVWMLSQIPVPTPEDVAHRSLRKQMTNGDRRSFFRRHTLGLCCLLGIYVLLTCMRSFRDDFAVEIWRDLGHAGQPAIFARTEILVMLGVLVINGAAIWINSNRRAFLGSLMLIGAGSLLVAVAVASEWQGRLTPFWLMVLVGLGTFIPYVAFHTTIFERLLAAFREKGTIGYLIYLADALGYVGYFGVMMLRNVAPSQISHLKLFMAASFLMACVSIVVTLFLIVHYSRRVPDQHQGLTAEPVFELGSR